MENERVFVATQGQREQKDSRPKMFEAVNGWAAQVCMRSLSEEKMVSKGRGRRLAQENEERVEEELERVNIDCTYCLEGSMWSG